MNILVTGSAGFIGSHLCERLLSQGHFVTGLDNFDDFYDPAVKKANIEQSLKSDKFEQITADIRDPESVDKAVKGQDCIVHLAARAGVRPSIEDPIGYSDVNINGTVIMLESARKYNISKFIFASSSSVYGNNKKVPFCETDNVDFPISPYAATKKSCELICHTYSSLYGIDMTCLRFFTVYGPRQRPDLAIHKFALLMEAGSPIPVYGDGSMSRDFTYIDDIIDGVCSAIEQCRGFEIFNLGESRPVRLDRLIELLEDLLGKRAIIDSKPVPPGDVFQTYADISKAADLLGYDPKTEVAEGLKKFVYWLGASHR